MQSFLELVFGTVINFAMLILFIRFMIDFAGLKPFQPMVKAAHQASKIVDVFAHIFPNIFHKRVSVAALILMLIVRFVDVSGNLAFAGFSYNPLQLIYVSLVSLISDFLQMCRYLIFASIIASFVILIREKSSEFLDIIIKVNEPILEPFRKITPNLGMIDISPMFAFFVIILIDTILEILSAHLLPMIMESPSLINFTLVKVLGFYA